MSLAAHKCISEQCNPQTNRSALVAALKQLKFVGASGAVSFDARGNRMGPWSLLNVQRGTWVRVDRWSDGAYKDSTAWPRASNKQRTMVAVLPSGLTSFPDSWGDAVTCKPGERQRWSDGNVVCLSCASGLFSNRANQTACLSCAAGFYAQRPASTGAPPCLATHSDAFVPA